MNPELTIRAIFTMDPAPRTIYFHTAYLDEAHPWFKGQAGFFDTRISSADDVPERHAAIDDMFRNSPEPTKTESEHAFKLSFVAMLGNVKAFILSICAAVVFAILLVSANTMAMSIRGRTREVAVLKTLGFTGGNVLSLFVGEAVALSLAGGATGYSGAAGVVQLLTHSPVGIGISNGLTVTLPTMVVALMVAASVGFFSAVLAGLQRLAHEYRRGAAPHWLSGKLKTMAIPISYNIRNLKLRKGLTIMTALGIALTVTTAIFLMALLAGLDRAFVTSGDPLNVLVMRKGSQAELSGGFDASLFPDAQDSAGHCQRQSRRADGFGRMGRGDRAAAQGWHRRNQRHGARHDAGWA